MIQRQSRSQLTTRCLRCAIGSAPYHREFPLTAANISGGHSWRTLLLPIPDPNSNDDIDKAIILLHLEDYAYDEIAAITGLSRTNVSVRLVRIRRALKQQIGNH